MSFGLGKLIPTCNYKCILSSHNRFSLLIWIVSKSRFEIKHVYFSKMFIFPSNKWKFYSFSWSFKYSLRHFWSHFETTLLSSKSSHPHHERQRQQYLERYEMCFFGKAVLNWVRRWDTGSGHRNSETGTETGIVWGEGDKLKQHQHLKILIFVLPQPQPQLISIMIVQDRKAIYKFCLKLRFCSRITNIVISLSWTKNCIKTLSLSFSPT